MAGFFRFPVKVYKEFLALIPSEVQAVAVRHTCIVPAWPWISRLLSEAGWKWRCATRRRATVQGELVRLLR